MRKLKVIHTLKGLQLLKYFFLIFFGGSQKHPTFQYSVLDMQLGIKRDVKNYTYSEKIGQKNSTKCHK